MAQALPPTVSKTRASAPVYSAPRWARPEDDASLRRLARAVPMAGDVTYVLEREPDYFALSRLQGESFHVATIDGPPHGEPIAVATCALVRLSVGGRLRKVLYACDARVHPAHRHAGLLGRLLAFFREATSELGAEFAFGIVLAKNDTMRKIIERTDAGFRFRRIAAIDNFTLFGGRAPILPHDTRIRRARLEDVPQMETLWERTQSGRDLVPHFHKRGFRDRGPCPVRFDISAYRVVEKHGRIRAFAALWDASGIKQLRLLRLPARLAVLRSLYNPLAALASRPRMARDGELLRFAYIARPAAEDNAAWASLLASIRDEATRAGYLYCDLALDSRDPLIGACRAITAKTTLAFDVYSIHWNDDPSPFAPERPVYFDMSLV